MPQGPLRVAWISFFPVDWLPEVPSEISSLPKLHPATWQRVLLDEFCRIGGLELHIFSVRKHYARDTSFKWGGTRSILGNSEGAAGQANGGTKVHFHCLRVPGGLRAASLFWWDTIKIRRKLRHLRPDLVHAWGSERGAALVGSRLGYPYLVTMQGLLQWYLEHVDLGRIVRLEARLEDVALKRAKVVTTESSFSVNWVREHYPRLDVRQIEHAPNRLFHEIKRQPEIAPVRFLYVAPLSEIKGGDLLVLGLDRLRKEFDFRLTIVGQPDSAFIEQVKQKTSAEIWNRIDFRTGLHQAQVADELSRATIVLFPTRVDTSPNSVKEAVVAGVPVVASRIGGITDYVLSGNNGFLFRSGDLDEFTNTVRDALRNPGFRGGIVDAAVLRTLQAQLSPKLMAEKFIGVYKDVIEPLRRGE